MPYQHQYSAILAVGGGRSGRVAQGVLHMENRPLWAESPREAWAAESPRANEEADSVREPCALSSVESAHTEVRQNARTAGQAPRGTKNDHENDSGVLEAGTD